MYLLSIVKKIPLHFKYLNRRFVSPHNYPVDPFHFYLDTDPLHETDPDMIVLQFFVCLF